jgi:transcriptional regulator with XRE-family HTH domain
VSVDRNQVSAEIAARVRAERARRGWTLDEFAARSGVSRRLVVQIESGDANPSLGTLLKLAAAIGVTLTELLTSQPQDRALALVPEEDAMTLWSTPSGSAARLLVSRGPLELWSWTLQPGEHHTSQAHGPGAVELLTVHAGTITLVVEDEGIEIPAGDSAWFDAAHAHAYRNPNATSAAFSLAVLEPA